MTNKQSPVWHSGRELPPEWGTRFERERQWRLWEKRFATQVLAEAQRLRKSQRLTAKEMSERLTAAGWPVTVNSVNGILGKKGRESISVPQLIALAEALDVSPMMLLFPPDSDFTEIRPAEQLPTAKALLWFANGTVLERPKETEGAGELIDRAVRAAIEQKGLDGAVDYLAGATLALERFREQLGYTRPVSPTSEWVRDAAGEYGQAADSAE